MYIILCWEVQFSPQQWRVNPDPAASLRTSSANIAQRHWVWKPDQEGASTTAPVLYHLSTQIMTSNILNSLWAVWFIVVRCIDIIVSILPDIKAAFELTVQTAVQGYHIYKDTWRPTILPSGELLESCDEYYNTRNASELEYVCLLFFK